MCACVRVHVRVCGPVWKKSDGPAVDALLTAVVTRTPVLPTPQLLNTPNASQILNSSNNYAVI